MATPYVAGLVVSEFLNFIGKPLDIKNQILNGVDIKSDYDGKIKSGGRLNAYKAVFP